MSARLRVHAGRGRIWLLILGIGLLVTVVALNDPRAVAAALLEVRFAVVPVIAAHLPVLVVAGLGWRVLLDPVERPGQLETLRLRVIKEAVNALLPVAQVGGDVVRARLAVSETLTLRRAAASCLVDVGIGVICLAIFLIAGLAVASITIGDPRLERLASEIAVAAVLTAFVLAMFERLGALRVLDRATERSAGVLGRLSGVGDSVRTMLRHPDRVSWSFLFHLLSWLLGVAETSVSLWAIGLDQSWRHAFVLESMAQGVRALGFAIPGALGVQEGGYVLICSVLGIPPDRAVALSLLRRIREFTLGAFGLALWRFQTPPLPEEPT